MLIDWRVNLNGCEVAGCESCREQILSKGKTVMKNL